MNHIIGNNIRTARKKIGLTQEELAIQLGVTAQAVSRWESNTGLPDISMVVPITQALAITTDTLFGLVEQTYDEQYFLSVKDHIDELHNNCQQPESCLSICRYLMTEIQKNPANYSVLCLFVEQTADLSRYIEYGSSIEEWNKFRNAAIQNGLQVIRYSNEKELVEQTHFALAWIYIHEHDYISAREHINTLPSITSNRIKESILAQLTFFEDGFDAMKQTVRSNLQNFTRAFNKEIRYAIEEYSWYASWEETVAFGNWGLKIIEVFSENPYMISYCRGFQRDLHMYIINAYLIGGKYENAGKEYHKLQEAMCRHQAYYQEVLANPDERKKYTARAIRYMTNYTDEFILKKQEEILNSILEWRGKEAYKKFLDMIK